MTTDAFDASTPTTERRTVAQALDRWLETPLLVLGLVWLALVTLELVDRLPASLDWLTTAIWAVFVAEFVLRFWIAEHRFRYVRTNWLTLLALAIPALRVLRIARVVPVLRATRAVRGVRAVRAATSIRRARRSLHAFLGSRHAVGYVAVLTASVVLVGAAAMLSLEAGSPTAFDGYAHALWWTAMLVTTMGSDVWPSTGEGRVVCLAISIYGFAVFGYVTASLASWLMGARGTKAEPGR